MRSETYIVKAKDAGVRLDIFLASQHLELSRSWIQKLIKMGNARINGSPTPANTALKESDEIVFEIVEQPTTTLKAERISPEPNIVFENDDFVILEKPAGIVIHPSGSTPNGTIVNWLLLKYPQIQGVGEDSLRPGIVHRLDKDTSGLMVVCKTNESFRYFKKQFKERNVLKTYIALVKGNIEQVEGTITLAIARDPNNPFKRRTLQAPHPLPQGAREAETYWHLKKAFKEFSLLEIVPKTGRMHQIRVHFAAIGHPIAGDTLYKGPALKELQRMFLHAAKLEFFGPEGNNYSFSSPLPNELEAIAAELEE